MIPEKTDQAANRKKKGRRGGRPFAHDTELYRDRNTVERCINKIKEWRGLATRYDKTPVSYLAGLHLRGAASGSAASHEDLNSAHSLKRFVAPLVEEDVAGLLDGFCCPSV